VKPEIIYFEAGKNAKFSAEVFDSVGVRGTQLLELAVLGLPIPPGCIINQELATSFKDQIYEAQLLKLLKTLSTKMGKTWADASTPMLLKIVISPPLQISSYPSIHNVGLTSTTIEGFAKYTSPAFAIGEFYYMLKGLISLENKILDIKDQKDKRQKLDQASAYLKNVPKVQKSQELITILEDITKKFEGLFAKNIFSDPKAQLMFALNRIKELLTLEEKAENSGPNDTAIILQPMVYGNFGNNSASGRCFTRNVVTGEAKIQGSFHKEVFHSEDEGLDIEKIEKAHYSILTSAAQKLESHLKEIREIRFTIENGQMFIIEQRHVTDKSTRADIALYLDLLKKKVVDEKFVVTSIKTDQLDELLHPVIKPESVKSFPVFRGGISGAPGAAIGRVYFSAEDLITAVKNAQKYNEDTRMILVMPATYANDVKGVEASTGVLSSEGGYSAHASVVARQYGKVSLVNTTIKIIPEKKVFKIGQYTVKEGEYITLNVPHYGEPSIYIGKAELMESKPESSGLLDFLEITKKFVKEFNVRANADSPGSAELALKFGAEGIGLCRTEHMFFDASRINVFREMIFSETKEERVKVLNKLKAMQKKDFSGILKVMAGKEVTIRLLDAPFHEFLPHNTAEAQEYLNYLKQRPGGTKLTIDAILNRTAELHEFNPMLGHRGSRIAVTYPEIYEMQVTAILEAAYELQKQKIDVHPEIMLPVIMNEHELKLLIYGKKIEGQSYKGLLEVAEEVRKQYKDQKPIHFKVGTMVEIPAAAITAGKLAKYAEFFSFGTNDLTQTTLGLSRDDFNSFMPDYTQYDLFTGNPFKFLDEAVKEMVSMGIKRGQLTRPDLITGLCGEQGAVPENIEFLMETGLNYVSCSPYQIPNALLSIAQLNIKKGKV